MTSDNPRTEEPMEIINDITQGNSKYLIEENRKMAILNQLKKAQNSVILIAGKGHEPYQEIMGVKHPYSDIDLVKEYINDL